MYIPRAMKIRVKRVYDDAEKDDGQRILVDRVWPRGIKKEDAALALWLKEIAPSTALRKWFGHDPKKWPEFQSRYAAELKANTDAVRTLRDALKKGNVTLVYGARDTQHNNAVALKSWLEKA